MISKWELPTSLDVGGVGFPIRTDYRAILDILSWYNNPDCEEDEKHLICLKILYVDEIPAALQQKALQEAFNFIDGPVEKEGGGKPRLMDWEQDAPILAPALNKSLGVEIRSVPYLHWWTLLGAYMSIQESLFSEVVAIRQKKSKRKKLEKYEQEFYRENKSLIDMHPRLSAEEQAEIDRLNEMLK